MIRALEMRYLAAAFMFILAGSATAAELFRYRGAANDGGTLEYIFETDQRDVPATATKQGCGNSRRVHDDVLSRPDWRTGNPGTPNRSDAVLVGLFFGYHQGPLRQLFFVVVMPDGTVVEPRVARRL
jgi:hypothetical protein